MAWRRPRRERQPPSEPEKALPLDGTKVPVGYVSLDKDGRVLEVNPKWYEILGYSRDEVRGRWFGDFVAPECQPAFRERFTELPSRDEILNVELSMVREDGRPVTILFNGTVERDSSGQVKRIHSFLHDVTEVLGPQELLERSEKRFRELFEHMSSCVAVYEARSSGEDFVFEDFNRAAEKVEQLRREDILGRSVLTVFPGVKEFGLFEVFQRVWQTGKPEHHPVAAYQDGRIQGWRENYIYKLPSGEVVAVYDDVTERKQMEEALQESEAKYREVAERAAEGIAIIQDMMVRYANPRLAKIWGESVSEVIGTPFINYVHPEERGFLVDRYKRRLAGEELPDIYEMKLQRRDGSKVFVEISASLSVYEGKPADVVMVRDITDRRRAETALRESEEKYRSLVESTEDSVYLVNRDGTYLFMNDRCRARLDESMERVIARRYGDFHAEDETKDFLGKLNRVFETSRSLHYEYRSLRDGRYFLRTLDPVDDPDGRTMAATVVSKDITELKEREAALRESEARYRLLFEKNLAGIYRSSLDGRFLDCNKAFAQIFGYDSPEEVLGLQASELYFVAADREAFITELRKRGTLTNREYRLRRRDASPVWVLETTSLIEEKTNGLAFLQGTVVDITERKQAEQERDRLFNLSLDLLCISGFDGNFKQLNPAWEKTLGWTNAELMSKSYLEFVHPEDRKATAHNVGRLGDGQVILSAENRYLCKDGSYRWLSWNSYPLVEEHLIFAVARDITERRGAEEQLKLAQEGTIRSVAAVAEMRDPYTAGHQERVTALACAIAREMGLDKDKIDGLRVAAELHDIGKVSIPAEILSKPAKLTEVEFSLVKEHPQTAYEILKGIEFPWPIADIILQHHERLDASGYPKGLSDGGICLEAKILAVADVVEAMASHRPYRPARGIDEALEEISAGKGRLYHPEAVEACVQLFAEGRFKFE